MTPPRRFGASTALTAFALALFCTRATSGGDEPLSASLFARSLPETDGSGRYQLWTDADLPTVADSGPDQAVEVGVTWMSDEPGTVTAIRFYKSTTNVSKHVAHLWTAAGELLAAAEFRNETPSGWQTVSLPEPVAILAGRLYIASYHTVGHYAADAGYFDAGRVRGPLHAPEDREHPNGVFGYGPSGTFPSESFKSSNYWVDVVLERGRDRTAPAVLSAVPVDGTTDVARSSPVRIAFSKPVDAATLTPSTVFIRPDKPGSKPVDAAMAYDAVSRTVTWTPAAPLAPSTAYRLTVKGAGTLQLAADDVSGTDAASDAGDGDGPETCPCMLFGQAVPAVLDSGQGQPVELGMQWRSNVDGVITGLRFYKAPGDQGPHEGHVWTADGRLLTTVRFTNESASGWQRALLADDLDISADTTYVVSYYSKSGRYPYNPAYFTGPRSRGPLRAPGVPTPNGVFSYGASGTFPARSYNATNYWVDVIFNAKRAEASPPARPSPPAPERARPSAASHAVMDIAGNALAADYTLTFVTTRSDDTCPCTLFGSALPETFDVGPDSGAELGVRFTPSIDGFITGLRFYKSAANAGPHVGRLWGPDGTLLATVSFTSETPSGWQETALSTPVAVQAKTTYTASYSATRGHYSMTVNGLASVVVAGPLRAAADGPKGGNGVFRYGSDAMPTSTHRASNYWVDVVFVRQRP